MRPLSKIETCPREILERIAIFLVGFSFIGPPVDILTLLLLSKTVWMSLSRENNPYVYSQIFLSGFDIGSPMARFGADRAFSTRLADELVRRCQGLKRLKYKEYTRHANGYRVDDYLRRDLWMAYLMFLENDGKNCTQLIQYARVDSFALNFVRIGGQLHDGMVDNEGWTVDNEVNALAVWLFWFTDEERVASESKTQRQEILGAFAQLFVGSFKYASSPAPITSFLLPSAAFPSPPSRTSTFSLAASPLSDPCIIPDHFGFVVTLARPLITPPVLLSCAVRLEATNSEMTLHLPSHTPTTRTEAIALGWEGPTQEDHEEQKKATTKFVEWSEDDDDRAGSERHEHDWGRLLNCLNPWSRSMARGRVYTLGMLDGLWVGRWFGIPMNEFEQILSMNQAETGSSPLVYSIPMQFRIREHHQYRQNERVDFDDISLDGEGKGVFNAWFPERTSMAQIGDELQVYVPNNTIPFTYETYDPITAAAKAAMDEELTDGGKQCGGYGGGVHDIILTAETDPDFGDAWGHKEYYGRVREWDGLVVLVRKATEDEGTWIFRGYVHGKQNLVGRWRETGTPVDAPGWEGVWSMTRKEAM